MYICIYRYIEECIFRQEVIIQASFLKTMEHFLFFLIVIFQVFLLFLLYRNLGDKGIVP